MCEDQALKKPTGNSAKEAKIRSLVTFISQLLNKLMSGKMCRDSSHMVSKTSVDHREGPTYSGTGDKKEKESFRNIRQQKS